MILIAHSGSIKGKCSLCPNQKKSVIYSFFFRFGSSTAFLYYSGLFLKREQDVDAICRAPKSAQFIPKSLLNRYKVNNTLWGTEGAISYSDIPFVLSIFGKFCLHPYFLLKLLFKVAKYSALIYEYRVSAIIVNDEFSFTSSIMTLFCERHNVKHINAQHGEKTFFIRDSFFRFS